MTTRDAYDVLDDLNAAGVHIIVNGDRLQWRCNPTRPPVHGNLFLELADHKAAVIDILLTVPAGCPQPGMCSRLGICPREIESSACTYAEPPTAASGRDPPRRSQDASGRPPRPRIEQQGNNTMTDRTIHQIHAEQIAEIEKAAAEREAQHQQAEAARLKREAEERSTWRERRQAELDRQRKEREDAEAQKLEAALWQRYRATGGSRADFDADRDELIREHRRDVALGRAEPLDSQDLADPKRWGLA